MSKIAILIASVRTGRKSDRVALYFKNLMEEKKHEVTMVDLMEYNFPVFDERLRFMKTPTAAMKKFSETISGSDGVIIVTPEYNGGYPASLKNVVDLLYDEWKRKPLAITTVSAGPFAGSQVITSLLFTLWKIGAWVVPAMFPVPNVEKSFDEKGMPAEKEATDKRAAKFIEELTWCMEASAKMR